ncbi:hypothetical protein TNCV_2077371 [Trichonephila clavipes]|nr:hypothetical protein TNCV_2077371 [Trichonephila clavipes]
MHDIPNDISVHSRPVKSLANPVKSFRETKVSCGGGRHECLSMSARRCLGMTGNHNFPSGSKFFPAKDTVDESEFFVLDELLKSFNFARSWIFFLFHRKVHTRRDC